MDFLKTTSYCDFCPLEASIKSKKLKRVTKQNEFSIFYNTPSNKDNLDILILTDCVELPADNDRLKAYIRKLGFTNFAIAPAIGCRTMGYELPAPLYSTYSSCKCLNLTEINPKVVLTMGKALFTFTKSSVFDSWLTFNEILFNQTWFLPSFNSKFNFRIYPTTFISGVLITDSFENLHFKTQLNNIREYLSTYVPNEKPTYTIEIVSDFNKFIEDYSNKKYVAIDTETNSLNVFIEGFRVGCITISFDGITGYYLPYSIIDGYKFSEFLNSKFCIWANGKYDVKALERHSVKDIRVDEDINILFHIMNTERPSNSIKVLAWLIGFGGYDKKLSSYISKYKLTSYLDVPEEILSNYAGLDAIVTFRLWQYAKKYLIPKQPQTYQLYRQKVIPVIPVLKDMETEGILIDREYLKNYHDTLMEKKALIEKEIYALVGRKFNIGSNDVLAGILESMGCKDYGRTKKGVYKTGVELMHKWEADGHKLATLLLQYRSVAKLDNTFVGDDTEEEVGFLTSEKESSSGGEGLTKYIMSDGRIHGTIMPALTSSWRSLSYDPNLQNQVKKGEEGKRFRQVFKAPDDYLISEADYSGFQLRLMAIYSKDKNMIQAFTKNGGDLHSVTGHDIFCNTVSLEEFISNKKKDPYKTARDHGKVTNLAFAFNQSPFSFQTSIKQEWSQEQTDDYIRNLKDDNLIIDKHTNLVNEYLTIATDINNRFFKKYPELKEYILEMQRFGYVNGYVDCPIFPGLRRHMPALLQKSSKLVKDQASYYSGLDNITANTGAQGGEGIILYQALTSIDREIKQRNLKSRLIATVHDSIVSYIHKSEIKEMWYILKNAMEVYDYDVPIVCEIEIGKIWGFSEEVTESNLEEFCKRHAI